MAAAAAEHTITVNVGHIVAAPPKGEPLDEYIARRVSEEIERQLAPRAVTINITVPEGADPEEIARVAAMHFPVRRG